MKKVNAESSGLYYGWIIVAVITLSSLASAAQINPTIGVFLKPITEEFQWTRSAIAGAVAGGTLIGGALAMFVGPFIDRHGPRWILFISFLFAGGALMSIGRISNIFELYAAIFISRITLQGVINLTNQTIVSKWFIRQRGRAVAIAGLGQRVGGGVVPFLTQQFILLSSWRTASLFVGLFVWSVTLIPVGIWMRRRPQDLGLLPDGDKPIEPASIETAAKKDSKGSISSTGELTYNLRGALRTRPFWVIMFTFCLTNFVNTGVNFNLLPLLTDNGLTESQAAIVLLVWALVTLPANMILGMFAERFSVRSLMAILTFGVGIGISILLIVDNFAMGLGFAVIHGACFGGSFLILQLFVPNYFGSASVATLRGFIVPWQMICNAMGPLAATLVFDMTSSYNLILFVYIILQGALILALMTALPSTKRWEEMNS